MGNLIQVDTEMLNRDRITANEKIEQVRRSLNYVYALVREMDAMWDGTANEAFRQVFSRDKELFNLVCDEGKALVNSINTARAEYVKCESQVSDAINAIRI